MNKHLIWLLCFSVQMAVSSVHAEEHALHFESLLSAHTRLMVFSPHPDDETLGAGGLMQRILHKGGAVTVAFMTSGDGYLEGVELEKRVSHPTARDYRHYGALRQQEALQVLTTLGVKTEDVIFFGFPDRGLCPILAKYWPDKPPYYTSPFTLQDRPPPGDVLLPHTEYNGQDLQREIARVLLAFRPTLILVPDPADQHPDHCTTYFFVREALKQLREREPAFQPALFTFLIHYGQWPTGEGPGTGTQLRPPPGFLQNDAVWFSLALSPDEAATKRKVLQQYQSQMLVMGGYLLSFARTSELFFPDHERTEAERKRCCDE